MGLSHPKELESSSVTAWADYLSVCLLKNKIMPQKARTDGCTRQTDAADRQTDRFSRQIEQVWSNSSMKDSIGTILGVVGMVGAAIFFGGGTMQQQMAARDRIQAEVQKSDVAAAAADVQRSATEEQLKATKESQALEVERLRQEDAIARQRYQSNPRSPGGGISVAAGMALRDPMTGRSLPDGTIIADSSGNTAVIVQGVTARLARLTSATPRDILGRDNFERFYPKVAPATTNPQGTLK